MEITFAIIGTAGRGDDAKRLSKAHYDAMCIVAEGLIDQFGENNYPITTLVSGGAAWADHVAVNLFLKKKVPRLRLFLPCEWNDGQFKTKAAIVSNGDSLENNHWVSNMDTGQILNDYHKKFFNRTRIHSLSEIQSAKSNGAELYPCRGGFYGRNAMVAKSDFVLAMTFGNKHEVKDGGTADTVRRYLDRVRKESIFDKSFHYDLNSGEVFQGCMIPKLTEQEKLLKELKRKRPILQNL